MMEEFFNVLGIGRQLALFGAIEANFANNHRKCAKNAVFLLTGSLHQSHGIRARYAKTRMNIGANVFRPGTNAIR
jgi:hypothetical protein